MRYTRFCSATSFDSSILVAVAAVLVAISIPIFSGKLEQSKESTDAANLRAAYASVMACALTGEKEDGIDVKTSNGAVTEVTATVECKQSQDGWQSTNIADIGGVKVAADTTTGYAGIPTKVGGSWTVKYTASTGKVTFE